MQRRAYISKLPSTPQQARYTAAPSAYTDPTVSASPPNPWGSNFGGCAGCGDLGTEPLEHHQRLALIGLSAFAAYGFMRYLGVKSTLALAAPFFVGAAVVARES